MILVFPPIAKACEPPPGLAALAGALRAAGVPVAVWDANLEGQRHLLQGPFPVSTTWDRRAAARKDDHLAALRLEGTYARPDRYRRAVADLDHLLGSAGCGTGARPGLADYRHATLSPLRSADLLRAAEHPEECPFHDFFAARLDALLDEAGESRPWVGLSLNYLSQALPGFALAGLLRRRHPEVRLVLGGGLVTSWMRRPLWRNPFAGLADHLVAGPGEGPLLDLLDAPARPGGPVPPDFAGLPLADYLSPRPVLPYAAASGCWWGRCAFCPERAEGMAYRAKPFGRVAGELRALAAGPAEGLVHFLDNALPPALLDRLADEPPPWPWYGFARFDRQLADPAFCRRLRAAGCVMLKLGLESGDQGVLDRLGKGIELPAAAAALHALRAAGIAAYVYVLFGTPPEGEAQARRTLDFLAAHHEAVGFLNVAVFNLPLGAPEAAGLETRPFSEGDLSLYTDFRHPLGWDRLQVRRFLRGEFGRHPAVAAILRRDPPFFTSNHAPFFPPSGR